MSVYSLPYLAVRKRDETHFSPRMRTRFWISSFSAHCFSLTSRTFSSLPYRSLPSLTPTRSGNTPKLSRPTTPRPPTASALAESPSVTISVASPECFVPALFASSSLGMSSSYD